MLLALIEAAGNAVYNFLLREPMIRTRLTERFGIQFCVRRWRMSPAGPLRPLSPAQVDLELSAEVMRAL